MTSIGSHLIEALLTERNQVMALDILSSYLKGEVKYATENPRLEFEYMKLKETAHLSWCLEATGSNAKLAKLDLDAKVLLEWPLKNSSESE